MSPSRARAVTGTLRPIRRPIRAYDTHQPDRSAIISLSKIEFITKVLSASLAHLPKKNGRRVRQ